MGVRLQVHPTSVTNLVAGLELIGYAERTPHPDDRRTTLANITAEGRRVAAEATERLNAARFGIGELRGAQLREMTEVLESLRLEAGDFVSQSQPVPLPRH